MSAPTPDGSCVAAKTVTTLYRHDVTYNAVSAAAADAPTDDLHDIGRAGHVHEHDDASLRSTNTTRARAVVVEVADHVSA